MEKAKNPIKSRQKDTMTFQISGVTYPDMNKCARAAVEQHISNNPGISFPQLEKAFHRGKNSSYVSRSRGNSRAQPISLTIAGKPVFVYSQFRYGGSQGNWQEFVDVCRANGIIII